MKHVDPDLGRASLALPAPDPATIRQPTAQSRVQPIQLRWAHGQPTGPCRVPAIQPPRSSLVLRRERISCLGSKNPVYLAWRSQAKNLCRNWYQLRQFRFKTKLIIVGPPRAHRSASRATQPAVTFFSSAGPPWAHRSATCSTDPVTTHRSAPRPTTGPPRDQRSSPCATHPAAAFTFSYAGLPRAHRSSPRAAHPAAAFSFFPVCGKIIETR